MIDLDAPIMPGKGAAGLSIGTGVSNLLAAVRPRSTRTRFDAVKYDLGEISVLSKSGNIAEIGLYPGYWGILPPAIHIGSTIADVEDCYGCSVEEDDDDNLIVPGFHGWCFETEQWKGLHTVSDNRNARIIAIFVFEVF